MASSAEFIEKVKSEERAKVLKEASKHVVGFVKAAKTSVQVHNKLPVKSTNTLMFNCTSLTESDINFLDAVAAEMPSLLKKEFSDAEFHVSYTTEQVWLSKILRILDGIQVVFTIAPTWPSSVMPTPTMNPMDEPTLPKVTDSLLADGLRQRV